MFGWMKWGKPAHPLADPKAVRDLLAALPQDPSRALDGMSAALDSVTQARELNAAQRWQIVDALDRGVITPRRRIEQDYVAAARLAKSDEERSWKAAFGFWKALGGAYLRCIENIKIAAAGAEEVPAELPLIAGRALRATARQLKWAFLRQDKVDERIWRELGSAYLFADSQGVAMQRAEIYPEEKEGSSARDELLKALLLVTAAPYNLAPLKLHIAERVIAHLGSRFALQGQFSAECAFAFDLAKARPPARAQPEAVASPTMRFFGAGEAEQALATLARDIRAKDGIPAELNLGGQFDPGVVQFVVSHLARLWNSTPPVRRAERHRSAVRVTVVPGFPNILRALELLASGVALDPKNLPEQETWTTFNRSEGGYGFLVPNKRPTFDYDPLTGAHASAGDWLRAGSLLALGEAESRTWRLGVVRRLTAEPADQRYVGIELLKGTALVVKLASATGTQSAESERRRSALLLASATEPADDALVLLRAGHFLPTQRLSMQLENQRYLLAPVELIESGEDFDCGRFSLVPA